MNKDLLIKLLSSFFLLFKARITMISIDNSIVNGTVEWEDEKDEQIVRLRVNEQHDLNRLELLLRYMGENNLIEGDKVKVSESQLISLLISSGWTASEAQKAIDDMCDFEVKMIDKGKETDSFFVHF